jgi:hypothetical protein
MTERQLVGRVVTKVQLLEQATNCGCCGTDVIAAIMRDSG